MKCNPIITALTAFVLTISGTTVLSYLSLNDINDFYSWSFALISSQELAPALDLNEIFPQASAQLQLSNNQSGVNLTAGVEVGPVTATTTGPFPISNLTVQNEVRPLLGGHQPHDFKITILGIFPGSNQVMELNSPFPGSSGGWVFSFPAGTQYNVKELNLPPSLSDYRTAYSPGCQGVLQPGKNSYCVIINFDVNSPIASSLSNTTGMTLNSTADFRDSRIFSDHLTQ